MRAASAPATDWWLRDDPTTLVFTSRDWPEEATFQLKTLNFREIYHLFTPLTLVELEWGREGVYTSSWPGQGPIDFCREILEIIDRPEFTPRKNVEHHRGAAMARRRLAIAKEGRPLSLAEVEELEKEIDALIADDGVPPKDRLAGALLGLTCLRQYGDAKFASLGRERYAEWTLALVVRVENIPCNHRGLRFSLALRHLACLSGKAWTLYAKSMVTCFEDLGDWPSYRRLCVEAQEPRK